MFFMFFHYDTRNKLTKILFDGISTAQSSMWTSGHGKNGPKRQFAIWLTIFWPGLWVWLLFRFAYAANLKPILDKFLTATLTEDKEDGD